MKLFDEILEEQFKKLFPYKQLTAPEKAAILLTVAEWLKQNRVATSDRILAYQTREMIQYEYDKLISALLDISNQSEGEK